MSFLSFCTISGRGREGGRTTGLGLTYRISTGEGTGVGGRKREGGSCLFLFYAKRRGGERKACYLSKKKKEGFGAQGGREEGGRDGKLITMKEGKRERGSYSASLSTREKGRGGTKRERRRGSRSSFSVKKGGRGGRPNCHFLQKREEYQKRKKKTTRLLFFDYLKEGKGGKGGGRLLQYRHDGEKISNVAQKREGRRGGARPPVERKKSA